MSRAYVVLPPEEEQPDIVCYTDPSDWCFVGSLIQPKTMSRFFDDNLRGISGEINQVLDRAKALNKDSQRSLAILATPDGNLMLAWVRHGAVGTRDEPNKLKRALGLV